MIRKVLREGCFFSHAEDQKSFFCSHSYRPLVGITKNESLRLTSVSISGAKVVVHAACVHPQVYGSRSPGRIHKHETLRLLQVR